MVTLRIPTAPVFRPLLEDARYKGAYGGRGSGKSHFFGELMVEECLRVPGTLAVCIREVQKSLMQSSKRLIELRFQQLGVGDQFKILHDRIITPGDGLIIFQGMQDATAELIKSLEGFRIAWVEEAQTLSQRSLSLLSAPARRTACACRQLSFSFKCRVTPAVRAVLCRITVSIPPRQAGVFPSVLAILSVIAIVRTLSRVRSPLETLSTTAIAS